MKSKSMYFVAFIMVNIICSDPGNTASAQSAKDDVDPSMPIIIDSFAGFVKKQISEPYQPILEPVVDIATQTIKETVKDQDPKALAVSMAKNTAGYIKKYMPKLSMPKVSMPKVSIPKVSVPSAQCVKDTILFSHRAAAGIFALEAGVAYFLISDAKISRQVKEDKLLQLDQTIQDLYQDSRITNCLNDTDNCNEADFNLAKDRFSRNIEYMVKDIQHYINWKKQVMIPAGAIATLSAGGLVYYSISTAGATLGSAVYTLGATAIGYGAAEQIFTYWELKECIKQVKEALEKELSKLNLECEYIIDIN